jgi:hypothetical protein
MDASDPTNYDQSNINPSADICTNGKLHVIELRRSGEGVRMQCRKCDTDLADWVHPKYR